MTRKTQLLVLVFVLGMAHGARAEDASPEALLSPRARAVLEADGGPDALRKAVRSTRTDVWMLAHELCLYGAFDRAAALTRVVDARRAEGLAAQIEAHRAIGPLHDELRTLWRPLAPLRKARNSKAILHLVAKFGESRSLLSRIRLLGDLAFAHQDAGRPRKAAALHDECAQRAWEITWRLQARNMWHGAGDQWDRAGEWERSLTSYRAAIRAADALGDAKRAAGYLNQVPMILRKMGRYDDMVTESEAAIVRYEALGDVMMVSWMQSTLASAYRRIGRMRAALASVEKALKNARAAKSALCVVYALNERGSTELALGRIDAAIESHKQAIAVNERRGKAKGAAGDMIMSRVRLGNALLRKGDYSNALRAYEAVESGSPIVSRHGRAQVLTKLGQFEQALALYEQNLAVYEKSKRNDKIAMTVNNIGNVLSELGEWEQAIEYLERALALKRTMNDRSGMGRTLQALVVAHNERGDYDEALRRAEEAEALALEVGDVRTAATVMTSRGVALRGLGRVEEALASIRESLRLLEGVPEAEFHAIAYRNLSFTHWENGAFAEALRAAYDAVRYSNDLVEGLGAEQGASARDQNISSYANGLAAAVSLDSPKDAAFFLESARASGLLEALEARRELSSRLLPEALREALREAQESARAASSQYAAARSRRALKATREARAAHEKARARLQEVVERIQREAVRLSQIAYPRPASLSEIRAGLAPGEAMLIYGEAREFICLVIQHDAARLVRLGRANEIRKRVRALRLEEHPYVDPQAVGALRKALVEPLGLGKVDRVLISPAGSLHVVPFALLFPSVELARVDSGTTYGLLRTETASREAVDPKAVLGLGDPTYPAPSGLSALPNTRDEVEAVARVALLGADATEARLREALATRPRWRSVHFACHGLLDVDRPLFSSLALTPSEDDDGLLTALEIFQLQLPAELVVLSACDTAGGRVFHADGVVGLTRAFAHAGVPRVISSLWKVDDEATRALMTEFYRLWNPPEGSGLSAAGALRSAQAHVRSQKRWAHPVYWAAWVLSGLPD